MKFDFDTVYERRGTSSTKWARFPDDVLPMPVADMDFRSPEPIRRALLERVEEGFYGYGRLFEEFHDVFGARLKRRYNWDVPTEALLPITGVIPGFNLALRALTTPGESIVVQLPSYGPILNSYKNHGLVRHDAYLVRGASGRYEIDWDSFEAAFDETTRAFVLCNPHNPVGRVYSSEELRRMAEITLAQGAYIISDEIHCDLMLGDSVHTPIASLAPEIAANTVTFMAPSKTFNLAGLKSAVAIIPNEDLRTRFEGAKSGLTGAVNVLGYVAMLAAYRDCDDWLNALTRYLTANRDHLASFVAERLPGVEVYPAEGTYLAWLDCNALNLPENDPFNWFLEHAKVGFSDGLNFGEAGRGFVRMNFGTPRALLVDGLERMERALATR
ncbi:MAG: MalY/PatB family protein [Dehalococcoidia bacterium]